MSEVIDRGQVTAHRVTVIEQLLEHLHVVCARRVDDTLTTRVRNGATVQRFGALAHDQTPDFDVDN